MQRIMSGECDNSLTTMDWLSAVHVKVTPSKNEFLESSLSLTSPTSSKDPYEDFVPFERETGKPSFSYTTLIKFAISSSKTKRMSLRQIYKWISDNFPYYKDARNGWKNSIRHNLSLSKCFVKAPRDKGDLGKGCYWSLREGIPLERPDMQGPSMRSQQFTLNDVGDQFDEHQSPDSCSSAVGSNVIVAGSVCSSISAIPDAAPVCVPELTDSTVGALAALISSQGDQVLGAAFAPALGCAAVQESQVAQEPQMYQLHQQPHQHHPHHSLPPHLQSSPVTPPPPPMSPPSTSGADQLGLSASLQTICRSLLGESSSGSSSAGTFVNGSLGAAATIGSGSHPPDLSASTLDFVQRMLPQLKDSFQLSESALHDLWDHCRSTSRPTATASGTATQSTACRNPPSNDIPLPAAEQWRQAPQVLAPKQPPPQVHQPGANAGQDVEDDFNWDSIL